MPELPEVETIRKKLLQKIRNKKIVGIDVLSAKNFVGDGELILNKEVLDITRVGKYLAIEVEGRRFLNVHLKMTGQMLYFEKSKSSDKSTRVIIYFHDESVLFFNDTRKFGYIKISNQKEKQHFIDILSKGFSLEYFLSKFGKSIKPIKTFLLDQEILAGLGNIYVNDALFLAGILPIRKVSSLSKKEIEKLYKSILSVINEGVKLGGATARDRGYVHPDGGHGKYQNVFKVYQRDGEKCLNCNSKISRIKQGGRSSFYCPKCQT